MLSLFTSIWRRKKCKQLWRQACFGEWLFMLDGSEHLQNVWSVCFDLCNSRHLGFAGMKSIHVSQTKNLGRLNVNAVL